MNSEEEELKHLRRAFAAVSQPATAPETCPTPEKIWEAVRGELSPGEVEAIVEHTAVCASCAEDWRLARVLQTAEPAVSTAPAPAGVVRYGPWQRVRTYVLAAAAALAVAVVGIQVYQAQQPDQGAAGYREGQQDAIQSRIADGAFLPRERFLLRWSAPAAAGASYDVEVSTEDLRVVASAEDLRTPELQVPASALAGLPTGSRLLWKVEADLPDGRHLSSPTFVTTVQ